MAKGKEIQDLVSLLRVQSPEHRKANIEYIQKMIKLQMLGNEIISNPKDEVSVDQMKEFLDLLIDITNQNKAASNKVEDATRLVLTGIDLKGFNLDDYISNNISE